MNLNRFAIGSILLISFNFCPSYSAETVAAKTDQRIELLSIVFRLAGNDEYNMNQFKSFFC